MKMQGLVVVAILFSVVLGVISTQYDGQENLKALLGRINSASSEQVEHADEIVNKPVQFELGKGKDLGKRDHEYWRGSGRIPDKAPCPAGLRDDGTSCWSDAHIYGKGCCCTIFGCCKDKCQSGYHDDGCTCRKTDVGIKKTLFERQSCKNDEEKYGALCYPKCKDDYVPKGCCYCIKYFVYPG